jgi:hypothetical protein
VRDVSGDFEIHLTGEAADAGRLEAFAARHGLKFVHIELDRGVHASQPMVTATGRGSRADQQAALWRWESELKDARIRLVRAKIETTPWSEGVPESDPEAWDEPSDRYFEHHIKLLLPAPAHELTGLVTAYGARLSRNARRTREDGAQERFVTQRCHQFGRDEARRRLQALIEALRAHAYEILEVESEYVVYDSNRRHDAGWLSNPSIPGWRTAGEARRRQAPAGSPDYPPTYRPLPSDPTVHQRSAFDPAMKHYGNAYRPGEPRFLIAAAGERWKTARRAAMNHVLAVVAETVWGTEAAIWTYERADGRRLVVPFRAPDGAEGTVQIDIVFGEELPIPPSPLRIPGVDRPMPAAPASLSLAWKLLWLATDMYPQGKDLYDAVLLAEHTTVALSLVRELMGPDGPGFAADAVLGWEVDWTNFTDEYPSVTGTAEEWQTRLAVALERAWAQR